MTAALRLLVVDDEPLARARLLTLLRELRSAAQPPVGECHEAATAMQAVDLLQRVDVDAVLLDIRMPGVDGLGLARTLRAMPVAPEVVFVTAHGEHAVQAFELEAADYLTKPVRLERLQAALQKVARRRSASIQAAAVDPAGEEFLPIEERGEVQRVPLSRVLCVRAEQKYLTVVTGSRSYLHDESLQALEERHGQRLLRVHRSVLVSREAMRSLERRTGDTPEGDGESWWLHLHGLAEPVPVSRRQLSIVREAMRQR